MARRIMFAWQGKTMDSEGSVTHWIRQLDGENPGLAQQEIWNRYFHRLVGLARIQLRDQPQREEDEEDVALNALNSFYLAAERGSYPQLANRTQLWRLLVKITASKASNQLRKQRAQIRGAGRVRGESALIRGEDDGEHALDLIVGKEPTPAFAAQIAEQCHSLMRELEDESLRRVARMKLAGYTNWEIADALDVVERTVERKLREIRLLWSASVTA